MDFNLIDELDLSVAQGHTSEFDNNSYAGLQVLMKAKKAGAVISPAVMGNIRVEFRGKDIINGHFSQYMNWANFFFGLPRNEQGAAGAYSYYGCFIPFYHPAMPNCIHKAVGESMNLYIEKAQEVVDEAIFEISGVFDDLPELYVPSLLSIKETAPKSKISFDLANIATVMISKPATTAFTSMQLKTENDLRFTGSFEILKDFTNNQTRIEASAVQSVLLDLIQKGAISEALSDSATFLSIGGVGDFYYTLLSLDFNEEKTIETANKVVQKTEAKLATQQNKIQTGNGVAVSKLIQPSITPAITPMPGPGASYTEKQLSAALGGLAATPTSTALYNYKNCLKRLEKGAASDYHKRIISEFEAKYGKGYK